ncbi:MAG: aldolase/citrate lyase family protein [Anaerolineae bacterium]
MKINTVKQRLSAGQPAIGIVAGLGSAVVAGVLARAGFDFVLVDNQHGNWDDTTSLHAFQAITLEGSVPFTRVRKNDFYAIGRMLDRGALGIVVPMVNSAADAAAAAYAMRYPPAGGRSYGFTLAEYHGSGYGSWIDEQVYLAVQIETAEAVARAEEILAVDGVDGCWIGPTDLAASLGTQRGSEAHAAAILRVLEACCKTGKVPGLHTYTLAEAQRWLEAGFRFITVGAETGLLLEGSRQLLQAMRRP